MTVLGLGVSILCGFSVFGVGRKMVLVEVMGGEKGLHGVSNVRLMWWEVVDDKRVDVIREENELHGASDTR